MKKFINILAIGAIALIPWFTVNTTSVSANETNLTINEDVEFYSIIPDGSLLQAPNVFERIQNNVSDALGDYYTYSIYENDLGQEVGISFDNSEGKTTSCVVCLDRNHNCLGVDDWFSFPDSCTLYTINETEKIPDIVLCFVKSVSPQMSFKDIRERLEIQIKKYDDVSTKFMIPFDGNLFYVSLRSDMAIDYIGLFNDTINYWLEDPYNSLDDIYCFDDDALNRISELTPDQKEKVAFTYVTHEEAVLTYDELLELYETGIVPDSSQNDIEDSMKYETDSGIVKTVQETLNAMGYECGTPDGIYGEKTKAAIIGFQEDQGMELTGEIDNNLLESLKIIEPKEIEIEATEESTDINTKENSNVTKNEKPSKENSSFSNKYGTPTTICAHPGCNNYIASTGDTNCCPTHSNRCLECGKYIDEDAMYCMDCIKNVEKQVSSFSNKYGTPTTICAHPGCNNYIASTGDTNCCPTHSSRCLECGKYIDEDAMYCMDCIKNVEKQVSGW